MSNNLIQKYWDIVKRELAEYASRPLYIVMLVIMPAFFCFFFLSLMSEGVPEGLPLAAVDKDNSTTSRTVLRTLDGMRNNDIVVHCKDFGEARKLMQQGEVYGIYYIPEKFEEELQASRQPKVSFYTNNAYVIPGSLLMQDMKTTSILVQSAVKQSTMRAKGISEDMLMGLLQPISVDVNCIGNASANYTIYLCNILLPGIIAIIIMLMTVYVMGREVKEQKSKELMVMSDNNLLLATVAKLTPLFATAMIVLTTLDVYMYKVMEVPCHCGLAEWLLITSIYVLACMAMSAFIYVLFPQMRMSLSIISLLSVLSVSMSGLTFPVSAMPSIMQAFSYIIPLRHLHLLYVDLGLNTSTLHYCWPNLVALLLFLLLIPISAGGSRLRRTYENMEYQA